MRVTPATTARAQRDLRSWTCHSCGSKIELTPHDDTESLEIRSCRGAHVCPACLEVAMGLFRDLLATLQPSS